MAKQVTDRQGAVNIVASAAETHADRLQGRFKEIFGDYLEGQEQLPDIGLVGKLVARRLRAVNGILAEKSLGYDRELADDARPREDRDSTAGTLASEVMDIRDTVEVAFGPAMVRELGLDGKTETESKAILAKAKRLVTELKDPKRVWPTPRRKGIVINPSAWVDDLEGPIAALEKALGDVARELREAQAAGDAKARAMTENDDEFSRSAGYFSAVFRLLRDDTLARKVRPSGRKPGRVAEPDEPTEGGEGG